MQSNIIYSLLRASNCVYVHVYFLDILSSCSFDSSSLSFNKADDDDIIFESVASFFFQNIILLDLFDFFID